MKRLLYPLVALAAFALAACMATGPLSTPESSIAAGANSLATVTTVATVALKNDKITVVQAKSYRTMLAAAGSMLDDADATLVACRKSTGSTAVTPNDPCKPSVMGMIGVALDSIANVRRTVDAAK